MSVEENRAAFERQVQMFPQRWPAARRDSVRRSFDKLTGYEIILQQQEADTHSRPPAQEQAEGGLASGGGKLPRAVKP